MSSPLPASQPVSLAPPEFIEKRKGEGESEGEGGGIKIYSPIHKTLLLAHRTENRDSDKK